jgi:hypothetical protein
MYRFYSNNFTTVATEDLMAQFRTECGEASACLKSATLVSDAELHVSINGGVSSLLFLDSDGSYKLTLPLGYVNISSMITDESGATVWLAGVY